MTYDMVKDHIVKQVQKTFVHGQDIAVSLRDLKIRDLTDSQFQPSRKISTETDSDKKKLEQDNYDTIYNVQVEEFVKRMNMLNSNLPKAYAYILSYCSTTIEHRIMNHPDYEGRILDDPIELLKTI